MRCKELKNGSMIWIISSDAAKKGLDLHGSFSVKHDPHSLEQNIDIPPERPVFDVFPIQTDNCVKVADLAAAADLPEAGDSCFVDILERWTGS